MSFHIQAAQVQATGQALIVNGDLTSARQLAITRARQQAALQAGAYLSTQQQLNDGVLSANTLSLEALANVGHARVLKEQVRSNMLSVLISVDITPRNQCASASANNYRKRIAIAAFPMLDRRQSTIGRLHNIESDLASELRKRLQRESNLEVLNAGHLMLQPNTSIAATQQLPQGALTTVLQQTRHLNVQYLVSGVVRDLSMLTPSVYREKNYFIDKYNKYDYLSSKYLRAFEVDLFIHDGFTGTLLAQKSFRTAGLWGNSDRQTFGFASSPFWQLDYGKQVSLELDRMAQTIDDTLACNSFTVEISRTDESNIWFNVGSAAGVKAGDMFDVYRKSTFYNQDNSASVELIKTSLVLTVDQVQSNSAKGRVNGLTGHSNIQSGDILMSR
ncbi:MAG: flagellar assembly protein T N-terminal domain-containing protein [Pseudomonadales bacterium]